MPPFLGGLVLLHSERKESMPIKVPDGLPAIDILREENITLITESAAFRQDIRPLQVAVVNIMPLKSITETQLLRLLCHSPLQVEVTFIYTSSHVSRNTHPDHLTKFYKCFEEVRQHRFDCIIITGAPVEILEFAEVKYWDELRTIMDWASSHVYSTFHLCWGAQA